MAASPIKSDIGLWLVPQATTPTLQDGLIWVTTAGVFARINGATVGPLGAGGGGGAWGAITGTLSAQGDLQSALDLKSALISPSFTTPAIGAATGTSLVLSGAIQIGSGTAIVKVVSATATLNFSSILAGGFEDLTITVTGATVGSTAIANPPVGSVTNNITYDAWVSAADTVTVRASNNNLVTAMDPASGTFRATVINF